MAGRPLPTEQEVRAWIRERRNWGRWGKDDQRGAMNLVTPEKRVAAARLVKNGRSGGVAARSCALESRS